VIQGASDVGVRLSEVELQRALNFCMKIFDPTTFKQYARLATKGNKTMLGTSQISELLDLKAFVVDPNIWEMESW
jgi:predicted glycosyltransferase